MTQTDRLKMNLPSYDEAGDIEVINENFEKLDKFSVIDDVRNTLDEFPLASENQRKKIRAIDTNTIYKSTEKKDGTWEWVAEGMGGNATDTFTTLTLPITAESYTLESDGTYSIELAVVGMTEDFIAPQSCKYARPNPYSPTTDKIYATEFAKIKTAIPLKDKIKVILSEIPTTSIDFYLFGI